MHYNGNARNGARHKKYQSKRASLNKFYTGSIVRNPSVIQLVALLVMWAVGMMMIFSYTDVFQSSISFDKGHYYLLILGSTTVLLTVIIAFFRSRSRV